MHKQKIEKTTGAIFPNTFFFFIVYQFEKNKKLVDVEIQYHFPQK